MLFYMDFTLVSALVAGQTPQNSRFIFCQFSKHLREDRAHLCQLFPEMLGSSWLSLTRVSNHRNKRRLCSHRWGLPLPPWKQVWGQHTLNCAEGRSISQRETRYHGRGREARRASCEGASAFWCSAWMVTSLKKALFILKPQKLIIRPSPWFYPQGLIFDEKTLEPTPFIRCWLIVPRTVFRKCDSGPYCTTHCGLD